MSYLSSVATSREATWSGWISWTPTIEPPRASINEDAHSERTRPGAQSGRVPATVVCWLPSRLKVITLVVNGAFFLRAAADTFGRSASSRRIWAAGERRSAARPRRTASPCCARPPPDTAAAAVRVVTVPSWPASLLPQQAGTDPESPQPCIHPAEIEVSGGTAVPRAGAGLPRAAPRPGWLYRVPPQH